jgi:hypothetical protein
MSPTKRHFIKPHRFARIICWASALLVWLELVLFGDMARADRRRIRQRYRFASLDWAERLVRALAVVRAVEMTGIKKIPRRPLRNATGAGFRRRLNRPGMMRATWVHVSAKRSRRAMRISA